MIFTSYFSNKNLPQDKVFVSISLYSPLWFPHPCLEARELAPTKRLLYDYKNNSMCFSEYRKRYYSETLSKLDAHEIFKKYNHGVFLCYEKEGEPCHRHIISEWLSSYGYDISEYSATEMVVAVVGSRGFSDYSYLEKILLRFSRNYKKIRFVSGGAQGTDSLVKKFCEKHNYNITVYNADWSKGNGAGYMRNVKIWDNCIMGICFWDGKSKGTAHSFSISKSQGKRCYVVEYLAKNIYLLNGKNKDAKVVGKKKGGLFDAKPI